MPSRSDPTSRESILAVLGALCLFLSTIEYMIPKPVPFFRLGLANLPIILSLSILDVRGILTLILLKVVGQGIVNGTLFSYIFLFSAAGSFSSGLLMVLLLRLLGRRISYIGISVCGALASNCAQIGLSYLWIFGIGTVLAAPFLLSIGTLSAAVLGGFAERFRRDSVWMCRIMGVEDSDGLG